MLISFNASRLGAWPLVKSLTVIRDAGYEAVELGWSQIEGELPDILTAKKLAVSGINLGELAGDRIGQQMKFVRQLGLSGINLQGGNRKAQSLEDLVCGLTDILPPSNSILANGPT